MTSAWWGMKGTGQTVHEAALERTRTVFDIVDVPIVSFSGGKDSTVVLNLALEVARERGQTPIEVFFYDEEAIPPPTIEYVERVAALPEVNLKWWCLPVRHRNACSESEGGWWWPWADEARDLWCREMPEQALTHEDMPGFDNDPARRPSVPEMLPLVERLYPGRSIAMLMGIRADESVIRRKAVANSRPENWLSTARGVRKAYVAYDWRTSDVWAAPQIFGWDYNRTYDIYEMLGKSHSSQRVAPPYGEEPRRDLWTWAEAWPEMWDKVSARVPGAATAARYSTTDLYNYGDVAPPPDGMSWKDYIVHILETRVSDDNRPQIAKKIAAMVRRHYNKTADPIVDVAVHPVSGISWKLLAKFAERGDHKSRMDMMVGGSSDPGVRHRQTVAYEAERSQPVKEQP